jgi:glycosyltransferase involved in cell wall biosynthesis
MYTSRTGASSARNTGVQFSKGEYLVFLDADDWLFDDALQNQCEHS